MCNVVFSDQYFINMRLIDRPFLLILKVPPTSTDDVGTTPMNIQLQATRSKHPPLPHSTPLHSTSHHTTPHLTSPRTPSTPLLLPRLSRKASPFVCPFVRLGLISSSDPTPLQHTCCHRMMASLVDSFASVSQREINHLMWQSEHFVASPEPRSRLRARASSRTAAAHKHGTRARVADITTALLLSNDMVGSDTEDAAADMYDVEAVLNERVQGGEQRYLVKWEGYGPEYNTWEPALNLAACSVFQRYMHAQEQAEDPEDPTFSPDGLADAAATQVAISTASPLKHHRVDNRHSKNQQLPRLHQTPLSTPLKATRPQQKVISRQAMFEALRSGCFSATPTKKSPVHLPTAEAFQHTPTRMVLDTSTHLALLLPVGGSATKSRTPSNVASSMRFRRELRQQLSVQSGTPVRNTSSNSNSIHPRKIVFASSIVREPVLSPSSSPLPFAATCTPAPPAPDRLARTPSAQSQRPTYCAGSCHHTNCVCDPKRALS